MEKLQAALQKARKSRAEMAKHGVSAPTGGVLQPEAAPSDADAAWAALTPFTPDPDLLLRNRILTYSAQAEAAPFDILRTKIQLMMNQNKWKRLAICSPEPSCGKTTIAANLALGFSRQPEMRTMLFDFDLRRPSLGKVLGHIPQHGVTDVLSKTVTPEEQFVRVNDNLVLALQNKRLSDPSRLVMSSQSATVVDEIEATYNPDFMIFDLSPLAVSDDVPALLQYADCALIIVRAEQSRVSALDVCERDVAEYTNILGIVLNSCRFLGKEVEYY